MRRSGIVAGLTVTALLVAVVAVRGDTAAVDADLAVGRSEPSPAPSVDATGPEPVLLAANGLPGLRLGAAPADRQPWGQAEAPGGCEMVWDSGGWRATSGTRQVSWEPSAWVVDGEVVSVVVNAWDDAPQGSTGLETWLGPTLGSPIEVAQELPGARTVTERPFGPLGPTVRVVTVPARGVEAVFSDVPVSGVADGRDEDPGRISTIEVRRPAGRVCALADVFVLSGGGPARGWTVDLDGVGPLRLGTTAAELGTTDGVTAEGAPSDDGGVGSCQAFGLDGDGRSGGSARALALDGVVTEVQVYGAGLGTSFGLPADADADDIRARFPEVAARSGPMMGSGTVRVPVDGVDVELQLQPELEWLPDLERPVEGGVPTVSGVLVRTPGALAYAC